MPKNAAPPAPRNAKMPLVWALAVGVLLGGTKFVAFVLTGSNAILTDALESLVNLAAGGFALYSVVLSARPRDENHPYGHGKIEYFAAGFEGGLITLAGLSMGINAVYGFFYPSTLAQLDLGIALSAATGAGNFLLGAWLIRAGRARRSLVLEADGKHLRADSLSSAGLVAGLGLVLWQPHLQWVDNFLALLLSGVIIREGLPLVRRAVAGLMDEQDAALLQRVADVLRDQRRPAWVDVHNLRIQQFGNRLHIDCHLTLPWYYNLQQTRAEQAALRAVLQAELQAVLELSIQADPCLPECCRACFLPDCPHRQAAFDRILDWSPERLLTNRKHQLHALEKSA